MASKYSFKNIDLINFLFLTVTPLVALVGTYVWVVKDGFHWGQVFLAIAFYLLTGLSITAGYHRLFAHKAYEAHPVVKFLFLIFGAAAFENSVMKWGSDHRIHHQKVDSSEDPYNIHEGFFYAHMGWVLLKKNSVVNEKYARDFQNDSLIYWQHKYYFFIAVIVGIILPTLLGGFLFDSYLGGFALSGMARIVFTHHCTFFINSLCHCVGSTPYTDTNSAKDSWIMAFFTFGEGYHNFHHYFQTDYRNGINWFQYDPTKWLIRGLNFLGLTFKLKLTPQDKIISAKMQMKAKMLRKSAGESAEKFLVELEKLKGQAIDSYLKWQELKAEYKRTKGHQAALALQELKEKIKLKKEEFEALFDQWELLVQNYVQAQALLKY